MSQSVWLWSTGLQGLVTQHRIYSQSILSSIRIVMEKQPECYSFWSLLCITCTQPPGGFICRVRHLQFSQQLLLILKFRKLKESREDPNSLFISSILLWQICEGVYWMFWFYSASSSLQNASGAPKYEHQKWWSTGCFGNAPPDSVADSLRSLMRNRAFNFAGIS